MKVISRKIDGKKFRHANHTCLIPGCIGSTLFNSDNNKPIFYTINLFIDAREYAVTLDLSKKEDLTYIIRLQEELTELLTKME